MAIHHTHTKQAEKIGVVLEPADIGVKVTWPERNIIMHAADAKEALRRIAVKQKEVREQEEQDRNPIPQPVPFAEDKPRKIGGVPTSGREAHLKGFTIVDNPFLREDADESEDSAKWEEDWEQSAEEALLAGEEAPEEKTGSVVKSKFRAIYAERGHPTHCGDELAVRLNQLVITGDKTDIGAFQQIMAVNSVDMSKYNTTNPGWQGRYRMTGRNKLAKVVHANGGLLKLPETWGMNDIHMSQEWMQSQRFK